MHAFAGAEYCCASGNAGWGAVVGAGVVWATGFVWTYPVLLALSVAVSLVAFRRRVVAGVGGTSPFPVSRSGGELRTHLGTAGINLAATAYASTPVPIVTVAFRPDVSSPFASADAAYRLGLFTVTAIVATGNHWVLDAVGGALVVGGGFGLAYLFQGPRARTTVAVAAGA